VIGNTPDFAFLIYAGFVIRLILRAAEGGFETRCFAALLSMRPSRS
jgi:hypothetical protein